MQKHTLYVKPVTHWYRWNHNSLIQESLLIQISLLQKKKEKENKDIDISIKKDSQQ